MKHRNEFGKDGCLDKHKVRENMEVAAEEAIRRLHGTPYAKGATHAVRAPTISV